MSRELIGWTILAAVEPTGFFNAFSPSMLEIREAVHAADIDSMDRAIAHLREGYRPALGLSMALGLGLSLLAKSPLPLAAAGATSLFMVASYESVLPRDRRLLPWGADVESRNYIDGSFRVLD